MSQHDDNQAVTAAELSEFIGMSARAVSDLGARGIAVKAGPGRWRLKESVARYCDDLRRQGRGMGGEAVVASAAAERGRLAKEQADALALKNARLRGSMLDAEAVEREWADILRTVQSGMLDLPSRIGARLPHLTADNRDKLHQEVRTVLSKLSR